MPATRLTVDPSHPDAASIEVAATALRSGGLVAFPTETVYGLGADATDERAVRRVFEAKGRPANDPLIVHVHPSWALSRVLDGPLPEPLRRLTESLWPGPLTIIGPRSASIAPSVTDGGPLVAVRAPAHPVALALLDATDRPVAAPSANRFSYVSPTSADHVAHDLGESCDVILDGGRTTWGIESTVVRLDGGALTILRHGATTAEQLVAAVGDLVAVEDPATDVDEDGGVSPGRAVRHYAPELRTVAATPAAIAAADLGAAADAARVVHLGYADRPAASHAAAHFVSLGSLADLPGIAWELYDTLRRLDAAGTADTLIIELTDEPGLGRAIDDRLRRAASGQLASTAAQLEAVLADASRSKGSGR